MEKFDAEVVNNWTEWIRLDYEKNHLPITSNVLTNQFPAPIIFETRKKQTEFEADNSTCGKKEILSKKDR